MSGTRKGGLPGDASGGAAGQACGSSSRRRGRGPDWVGFVVLLGVGKDDTEATGEALAEKIANLRVFDDGQGKMNRSLLETGGQALCVSQFTLYGDCRKGPSPKLRPSRCTRSSFVPLREFRCIPAPDGQSPRKQGGSAP